MNKIDETIAMLLAIQNYAKDIHYNCKGDAFYSKHLLCDRIAENMSDYIDGIKETIILARLETPKSSKEYMEEAINKVPDITDKDTENFKRLRFLMLNTLASIERIDRVSIGEENLLGNIAENLQNSVGLLNKQVM